MDTNFNVKALIFMKGVSERIPGKNLKKLNGKPLFHWIMESLNKSKYIDEIIINTDSKEIAKNASSNFNVTIHMRPEHLLDIHSNEANQIIAYDLSITEGEHFLQTHSTNPLLSTESLDKAIELYFSKIEKYNSLMSVTKVSKRFYSHQGKPINHNPNNVKKTQEINPLFEENSLIYIFSKSSFSKKKNRVGSCPLFFPISPYEAIDIDEPIDFELAESFMKLKN